MKKEVKKNSKDKNKLFTNCKKRQITKPNVSNKKIDWLIHKTKKTINCSLIDSKAIKVKVELEFLKTEDLFNGLQKIFEKPHNKKLREIIQKKQETDLY